MSDTLDPMNAGKTFVRRNEFLIFFITSYFLNTQTTVEAKELKLKPNFG